MWSLSPGIHHLNHGSFAAVPIEVQQRQTEWRSRWEASTTAFILEQYQPALDDARDVLSRFIGADPEGVVVVRNATQGVAAVLRSIEATLRPGDELVTTSHDYNAVRQTLEYTAARRHARVVVARVPFPLDSPEQVRQAVLAAVTPRTRLVVIDHITSPTGLILPIEEIVGELEPAIPVLVDGAHGPGQVPLHLDRLGASWYTGNLHKWVCAPKGAAFLHTREDRRGETVPTVISHAWNASLPAGVNRYQALFDWTGTDDASPWFVVPDAIRVVESMEPGGWPAVMKRNHELVLAARQLVCDCLGQDLPAPDELVGSMSTVELPDSKDPISKELLSPLNQRLLDAGFETLAMLWPAWPKQVVRISAHLYNDLEEYEAFARALRTLVG